MKWLLGLLCLFIFIGLIKGSGARASSVDSDDCEPGNQQESDEDFLARQRAQHYEDHYAPTLDEDRAHVHRGFADHDM